MAKKNFLNSNTVVLIAACFLLASCSTFSSSETPIVESNSDVLFKEGMESLNKGNYKDAIEKFETVEREHPASEIAPNAQIRRAYANYLDGNFNIAVLTIDEFVKQYPYHKDVPYMYYLKGLCYYDQIVDVGRDQDLTYKAINALNELVERFPNSVYAKDSKLKLEYAVNNLAGKEMEIGRFYLKKNNLISALGRFNTVIERYQTSIFTPEALFRLAEIHYAMGDLEQAQKFTAVLGHNYPSEEWYKRAYALMNDESYEETGSWFNKQLKKIW